MQPKCSLDLMMRETNYFQATSYMVSINFKVRFVNTSWHVYITHVVESSMNTTLLWLGNHCMMSWVSKVIM